MRIVVYRTMELCLEYFCILTPSIDISPTLCNASDSIAVQHQALSSDVRLICPLSFFLSFFPLLSLSSSCFSPLAVVQEMTVDGHLEVANRYDAVGNAKERGEGVFSTDPD